MPNYDLSVYLDLLQMFLQNRISAAEFERKYLALFKDDPTIRSEQEFAILDRLFASVDAFCPDPDICDENDLNEDQLREEVRSALEALTSVSMTRRPE